MGLTQRPIRYVHTVRTPVLYRAHLGVSPLVRSERHGSLFEIGSAVLSRQRCTLELYTVRDCIRKRPVIE